MNSDQIQREAQRVVEAHQAGPTENAEPLSHSSRHTTSPPTATAGTTCAPPARRSQATELIDLVHEQGIRLWHTPDGEPYATVTVDAHVEHHRLSSVVRGYLARAYYHRYRRSPASQALTDAQATLAGMAKYDGGEHPVAVRLACHGGQLYLDLGAPDWSIVETTAAGWHLTGAAPVRH